MNDGTTKGKLMLRSMELAKADELIQESRKLYEESRKLQEEAGNLFEQSKATSREAERKKEEAIQLMMKGYTGIRMGMCNIPYEGPPRFA